MSSTRPRQVPKILFPAELPISSHARDIIKAIRRHQVIIVSGETGCGKSTQLPKMCLAAGRGRKGRIACTQPRRIAAITIAQRIAAEMKEPLGRSVGYKIRFDDRTGKDVLIKVLTDGMLLAETQGDPRLSEYDTIIIDEAHERSLNIDFLLGIIRTLLKQRPDLKMIITSATLDIAKFSQAFDRAPVFKVGGRMYPVEVEYTSPPGKAADPEDVDYVDMAVKAVIGIKANKAAGDILVFMPTEQDILETKERLSGRKFPATTVLPLYARLQAAEQGRVYSVTGAKIVVATNVAETSLTIPGIRYVVDTGLARIARYLPGTRTNSLPISPISKSSSEQRKGRCGRVRKGVCIRLYSQDDFQTRPEFTPPEILRSDLAEVILRMINLKLGHPAVFPFVDKPDPGRIKDGYDSLLEMGAINKRGKEYYLTNKGSLMAKMPLDPKISRLLLEARKESCVREVAVIASALSIRDPRERPLERAAEADHLHAVFKHADSDFLTLLNIWHHYHEALVALDSQNKKRKFCREHYLSFTRMREWSQIHTQILAILKENKILLGRKSGSVINPARYAAIHKSILSGYLSNIAVNKEKNIYRSAKNKEVMIFPGSTLFNRSCAWIVAAEMVKTSRLFARIAAKIESKWLEALGGELCRRSYSSPRWSKSRGEVIADEKVTLYGLEIVSGRECPYGPINRAQAHEIFILSALVEGRIKKPPPFLKHNLTAQKKLARMEEKLRRRDILAQKQDLADFYSHKLPGLFDTKGLLLALQLSGMSDSLHMGPSDLLLTMPHESELKLFPDEFSVDEMTFALHYKFMPGEADDGATLQVAPGLLSSVPVEGLEWGLPGHFPEKINALIKGLPKRFRRQLVPVAEKAAVIERELQPQGRSLFAALADFAKKKFKVDIPAAEWAAVKLPEHLRLRIAVIDSTGKELAAGRDLSQLQQQSGALQEPHDPAAWQKARIAWEKTGITKWDFGDLPKEVPVGSYAHGYPGLEPAEKGVNIRLFASREKALAAHKLGVQSLLMLKFGRDLDFSRKYLELPEEYDPPALFFGGRRALLQGMTKNLQKEIFQQELRSQDEFLAYIETVNRALFEQGHKLQQTTLKILASYDSARGSLRRLKRSYSANRVVTAICERINSELERLVPKNFLERCSLSRLAHIPRYIDALRLRAERAPNDPEKDQKKAAQMDSFIQAWEELQKTSDQSPFSPEQKQALDDLYWQIEEFKVSLFAPELKTPFPISAKRLRSGLLNFNKL